ncbi:MAG: sugar ABC transporter substrate-binding protein [Planctomycetaceae bacterium]|nr:sugar ABC transporter substrate-binding protein [Planctomycetaceae bacterium]
MRIHARFMFGITALFLSACIAQATPAGEKHIIGYATSADTDVYIQRLKETFQALASQDPNMEVIYTDAGGDANRQLDQIDNFLVQGVDAMIVIAVDFAGVVMGIEKANEAGVPVICLAIKADGGDYVFVGSTHREAGELQGVFIRENLKQGGKIVYLGGYPGYSHTTERREGFREEALDKRPDIELLADMAANYDRDKGMQVMEDFIQAFPIIDAVVAANDQMALGAIEAMKAANRIDGVIVCGVDALPEAIDAIEEGTLTYTLLQNAEAQADACYKTLKDILDGKPTPREVSAPFEPVTKDNYLEYRK